MEIIHQREEFHIGHQTAVAIGKFDGVHRGHQQLLANILRQKEKGLKAVVFTFHPSASVFFGASASEEITTREEKRKLFERMGIDILIEFPLNHETASISPEKFVEQFLAGQMNAAYIAAGEDVSFGWRGKGDKKLLLQMSGQYGYQVRIIEKIYHGDREISSTYVREAVEKGDMETAKHLLGRHYSFEGQVKEGSHLGRKLGMPTLNLYPDKEKLLPPRGVYYSGVRIGERFYPGITNIGRKPTVNDSDGISVETYLYDFNQDIYGREIVTELLQFRRPEKKFEDIGALKAQMERDLDQGRVFHGIIKK